MLKTLSKFSYPAFIAVSGFAGTVADLLQKSDVSFAVALIFFALGIAILVLPSSFVVGRVWTGWLNQEMKQEYARLPFGLSCVCLALLLGGFSFLSSKAADEGGIIASSFPEVREMQISLGLLTANVTEIRSATNQIKEDTGKLLEASDRWLNFRLDMNGETGPDRMGVWHTVYHGSTPLIMNTTNLQFENVDLVISSPKMGVVYSKHYDFFADRQDRRDEMGVKKPYSALEVCLSAKRRGQDQWVIEKQSLELVPNGKPDYKIYQKSEASGVVTFQHKTTCHNVKQIFSAS